MKYCCKCNEAYNFGERNCPICHSEPTMIDGFTAYAPELAHSGGGFKPSYFKVLVELEKENFWFSSRNKLIIWALQKYASNFQSFLEVGCGTGFVLSGIREAFPDKTLLGSEIFTEGLKFASSRLADTLFMQMDARAIPFYEEFDVIGAFDVLEHIEDDQGVLQQLHFALKPEGILLLTVPQHPLLWSITDEFACHFRRYSRTELQQKLKESGFNIVRTSSFVSLLLPALMLSRWMTKRKANEDYDEIAEMRIPSWMNYIFNQMLRLEMLFIKKGLNFSLGGSRLVVAKKISKMAEES